MKIFNKCKDGGPKSNVDAYFLFEVKGFISIALLKFNKGTREEFHSHAFDALTWFLCGNLQESRIVDGRVIEKEYKRRLFPKFTSKDNLHKVLANKDSWCFTIRGPWVKTWYEVTKDFKIKTTFTNGRKIINQEPYNLEKNS